MELDPPCHELKSASNGEDECKVVVNSLLCYIYNKRACTSVEQLERFAHDHFSATEMRDACDTFKSVLLPRLPDLNNNNSKDSSLALLEASTALDVRTLLYIMNVCEQNGVPMPQFATVDVDLFANAPPNCDSLQQILAQVSSLKRAIQLFLTRRENEHVTTSCCSEMHSEQEESPALSVPLEPAAAAPTNCPSDVDRSANSVKSARQGGVHKRIEDAVLRIRAIKTEAPATEEAVEPKKLLNNECVLKFAQPNSSSLNDMFNSLLFPSPTFVAEIFEKKFPAKPAPYQTSNGCSPIDYHLQQTHKLSNSKSAFPKSQSTDMITESNDTNAYKPYVCQQENCHKRFANKFLLKKHEFIHTGERPHQCIYCSKKFNRKDNLLRHRKTHEAAMLPGSLLSSNECQNLDDVPPGKLDSLVAANNANNGSANESNDDSSPAFRTNSFSLFIDEKQSQQGACIPSS